MKIRILILVLVMFAFSFLPTKAYSVDTSGSFGVDVFNTYVWRGIQFSDTTGVIQPSVTATYGSVSANMWASYDIDAGTNAETDFTLSYARAMDKISLELGYIYYSFGGTVDFDTQEIYVSVGYDTFLSPSLTYYQDIEGGDGGGFAVASISHELKISEGLVASLGASASVNFKNSIMGQNAALEDFTGLYNGEVSASVPFSPFSDKAIVLEPMVAYSFSLSDDAQDAIEDLNFGTASSNLFYAGIGLSVGF